MLVIDFKGQKLEGNGDVAIEVIMHGAVYEARPEVAGIVRRRARRALRRDVLPPAPPEEFLGGNAAGRPAPVTDSTETDRTIHPRFLS